MAGNSQVATRNRRLHNDLDVIREGRWEERGLLEGDIMIDQLVPNLLSLFKSSFTFGKHNHNRLQLSHNFVPRLIKQLALNKEQINAMEMQTEDKPY